MKTIKKVNYRPVFVEFMPDFSEMKEGDVYISERFCVSVHKCLCGCGEKTVLPFERSGWTLIKNSEGVVSFTPSVGNFQLPCKSHYIMTKNVANFV